MGAWGTKLYEDDTTCEVRDEFKAHLQRGLSPAEAEKAILDARPDTLSDHHLACLIYFALAETQWKLGCLSESVKQRAEALLRDGGDVTYWQEDAPSEAWARARVLAQLSARLQEPQKAWKPPKVKVPRPLKPQVLAPLGTVFALQLPNGKLAALKFVDTHASEPWLKAMFRVLPWSGEAIPTLAMLEPVSDRSVPLFEVHDFLLEKLAALPESDRAVHLSGINDFTIMLDGRKKLTSSLIETGVVLPTRSPLPAERMMHPYLSLDYVLQRLQDALASDTMADGARP